MKPRIGISACLLGERVRHNGESKRHDWLVDVLAPHVQWVPFCPEVEMGLGVPRPTLRLIGRAPDPRLIVIKTGEDLTARATTASEKVLNRVGELDFCILKKDSPSCGFERVKVYGKNSIPIKDGSGIFAARLRDRFAQLPIIEEGRLADPAQRENFLIRLFALARFRRLERKTSALQLFHQEYKLLLLAFDPVAYRVLGRIAARPAVRGKAGAIFEAYEEGLVKALDNVPAPKKWFNSLQHMAGYFKNKLDGREKAELHRQLESYRKGNIPLIAPLALLRFLSQRHEERYLLGQALFEPYPEGLTVRI